MCTSFKSILEKVRASMDKSHLVRDKGTTFEEIACIFLKNEPVYKNLYSQVFTYSEWAFLNNKKAIDTGIDLVAVTRERQEYHAIQCKFYKEDHKIQKSDIDSFFTASGKKDFSHRIIITTSNIWSDNARESLEDQKIPVTLIDSHEFEKSKIDWESYINYGSITFKPKKELRPHQKQALDKVKEGFKKYSRGRLIMACGTGKTFTSLKIAEEVVSVGGIILFLVPSLSLLSQTLREWTQESSVRLRSFAVCSDSDVGKRNTDDAFLIRTSELKYPATTDAYRLAQVVSQDHDPLTITVIFSTYHSLEVIIESQKKYGLVPFDLIICDEAHRTTGITDIEKAKEKEKEEQISPFVKVHHDTNVKASLRLYMTATPRVYGNVAKITAEKNQFSLASMDDESLFGPEFFVLTFSEAVEKNLLVDYKVIVLSISEDYISSRLQDLLSDEGNGIKVDDAARIIGCWKALCKQGTSEESSGPMKRAVAFCQVIESTTKHKTHRVSSKKMAQMFSQVVEEYKKSPISDEDISELPDLKCEVTHIDGSMSALEKEKKLSWLKEESKKSVCRILSNVRCLSEGVDVPSLDAVLFLTPRESQVDVVQSVGRVMRLSPDKKMGYVILPVIVPSGKIPHEMLNENKDYRVVWQVLNALRSHDDRFDNLINTMDIISDTTEGREAIQKKIEVIAVTDNINTARVKEKPNQDALSQAKKNSTIGRAASSQNSISTTKEIAKNIPIAFGELEKGLYAKIVEKCGNRFYWEDWAHDIADIANRHIYRIKEILDNPKNEEEHKAFEEFQQDLQKEISPHLEREEIIEMLAQHMVTEPVFKALFGDLSDESGSFVSRNPISKAMKKILIALEKHSLQKENDTLDRFYKSVSQRVKGIHSAEGKQKIILELYDKFFKKAFPRMADRLGIVYTPIPVVDFILRSVNDLLKQEFNQSLEDPNVHIIDPFTGTGTFLTRLIELGIISKEHLPYKYANEIHANEIVLLAYYIATVNIETLYHAKIQPQKYEPFSGICFTDTFRIQTSSTEKEKPQASLNMQDEDLQINHLRVNRQKQLDIRIIVGNPPYSSGQKSANDNNQNSDYPELDQRIQQTYVAKGKAGSQKGLYDSYARAFRWASDRLQNAGIIGFVTNGNFVDRQSLNGLRACFSEEFTSIYIFNLRGDIRKNMLSAGRAKEGQNIFGNASMAGIAISFLVKNPQSLMKGQIFYYDIGEDLSREEKLKKIEALKSVHTLTQTQAWQLIQPNAYHDWIAQRNSNFQQYRPLGAKKNSQITPIFLNYSLGIVTNRDAWAYNFSKKALSLNMQRLIDFYNAERERVYPLLTGDLSLKEKQEIISRAVNPDPSRISWSRDLKKGISRNERGILKETCFRRCLYRPFTKQWLYCDNLFNEELSQMPSLFPEERVENQVICINGTGSRNNFCVLISNTISDLQFMQNTQCFPLYLYSQFSQQTLDSKGHSQVSSYQRQDSISDETLIYFKDFYHNPSLSKEDIFYYTYGLLHSSDYRSLFKDNLSKELPRLPRVKKESEFWQFSQAGRQLADWHLHYESVEMYPELTYRVENTSLRYSLLSAADENIFHLTTKGMSFSQEGKTYDRTKIIYNPYITIENIPLEAYDYVVNGKSAIQWVMERQAIHRDTRKGGSGIVNNANDWAKEMGNPRYALELIARVIHVSLATQKIIKNLPSLTLESFG